MRKSWVLCIAPGCKSLRIFDKSKALNNLNGAKKITLAFVRKFVNCLFFYVSIDFPTKFFIIFSKGNRILFPWRLSMMRLYIYVHWNGNLSKKFSHKIIKLCFNKYYPNDFHRKFIVNCSNFFIFLLMNIFQGKKVRESLEQTQSIMIRIIK